MPDQNKAEITARRAYSIYRGMKEPMTDPHWDDLSKDQRAMLEWVVRFAWLDGIDR